MGNEVTRVDCRKCKFYYITWNQNFPYGCSLFKIKARQMPSLVVFQSIGKRCENFEEKK